MTENEKNKESVYKLIIEKMTKFSARRVVWVNSVFTWTDKKDALATKHLLEKAETTDTVKVKFVEHIPDVPL